MNSSTRFGSPAAPLSAAAGVLRARALRAGIELAPVADVDLAAAVVAADAWSMLVKSSSLSNPSRHGEPAVRALAAILTRAAGHSSGLWTTDLSECSQDTEMLTAAEGHHDMAKDLYPLSSIDVLTRASSDLAAAGPGTRFSSYAALLLHVL